VDETREALLQAVLALGCALAVEHKMPAPAEAKDLLNYPLSLWWKDQLPVVQEFVSNPAASWIPLAEKIQEMLA